MAKLTEAVFATSLHPSQLGLRKITKGRKPFRNFEEEMGPQGVCKIPPQFRTNRTSGSGLRKFSGHLAWRRDTLTPGCCKGAVRPREVT